MEASNPLLPRYRSHKLVRAGLITGIEPKSPDSDVTVFLLHVHASAEAPAHTVRWEAAPSSLQNKPEAAVGMYLVQYEDGYFSFRPASAFEEGYKPAEEAKPQHERISGYRSLSDHEVALINVVKAHGTNVGWLVERVRTEPDADPRWVAIAETRMQEGFMALTRAIARPDSF